MAFEMERIRAAIRPQDVVTLAIALLGVAIALFLDDSVIRLIGVCVALLGGAALYMTLRQRLDDQVQVHSRRTTLPPPAFKTRTTTDPGSSTKRIHFDDFQDTFVVDVDLDDEAPRVSSNDAMERVEFRAEPQAPRPSRNDSSDDVEFSGGDDGSFRVVRTIIADTPGDATAPTRQDNPSASSSIQTEQGVAKATDTGRVDVAQTESAREDKPRWEKRAEKRNERRQEAQVAPQTEVAVKTESIPTVAAATVVAEAPNGVDPEPDPTMGRRQVQMILNDLASDDNEDAHGSEPRAEFVRLVSQVLNAVARSISARSIVFCWVNLQKRHIIPEAHLTTGIFEIRNGARLAINNDVVSQIAENGIPEILTDIGPAAEAELINYYAGPANTRSFVGVPVFFRREVVGVLAADSSELNAFDEASVATLAEYTRLITGLIRGYTEKYDLQLSARTLEAFERMQNAFAGAALSPNQVARVLVDQIGQLFDHQYIAMVLFDDNVREWRIAASYSAQADRHVDGLRPEMNNSLVGYVTRNAEETYLPVVDREVLFSAEESFARGGSFIAIPLVGTMRCYGSLAIAHGAPSAYIPRDMDLLRDLARFAAMAIEVHNVNHAIDSQSVHDELTGAYNAEFLAAMLARESGRARDYRKPLSYALISIDVPSSLRDAMSRELEDTMASSVGAAISSLVRPYDIIGRIDAGTFGVVLVERNDQESYLWAEKLRKDVAGRILAHGARKFSVTISVGICDQTDLSGSESIAGGARTALERARSGDGNAVILY